VNAETSRKRLILIELNEVNFDLARQYVESLNLRGFAAMFAGGVRRTASEGRYEQLEPWIQWVSAHSGLKADQHGIVRLGDIVASKVPQLFEQIEAEGFTVGAVSPMNAENRLQRAAYFLPDPWTRTKSDGSFWSRALTRALSQAVNDNADGRITLQSAVVLVLGLLRFARPRHYATYLRLALRSRGAPWRKALFLDLLIHDIHWRLMQAHKPNFSTVFVNAGAHIQHHYFFNSRGNSSQELRNPEWYVPAAADPIAEMLQLYDTLLREYLEDSDCDLIIATGLTQRPYDRVKFYYRLRDHEQFLREVGIRFSRVVPRMTRDFLIEFDDAAAAEQAERQLAALQVKGDGLRLFGEVDNRGTSLFVTLTYPHEITATTELAGDAAQVRLARHVVFVAIKNGMHASHGYLYCRGAVAQFAAGDGSHISHLYGTVMRYFGIERPDSGETNSEITRGLKA
jgi:hypothetical protein